MRAYHEGIPATDLMREEATRMTLTEPRYQHIVVDADGVPWIEDANMKVVELLLEQETSGDTPEQLQARYHH